MTEGGRIINIGSTNADRMPFAGGGPYAMSKSALVGLTKGLARDLGPKGITINNVQPGPVDTDMNPAHGDFADSLIPLMAVGRYGKAEEIASFVAYLVGPEAGYITGFQRTKNAIGVCVFFVGHRRIRNRNRRHPRRLGRRDTERRILEHQAIARVDTQAPRGRQEDIRRRFGRAYLWIIGRDDEVEQGEP
eukprot:gene5405-5283_t